MRAARLFKLFMVPGEEVENPGGLPNKNPMDDLNVDIQAWGGRVSLMLHDLLQQFRISEHGRILEMSSVNGQYQIIMILLC